MSTLGLTVDETTRVKKDPKNKLTFKERERIEYHENEENVHDIMEAGQDDRRKGIEAVKEQVKLEEADKKRKEDEFLNQLDAKKRFAVSYKSQLAEALGTMLEWLDWITGWKAYVVLTDGSPITIKGKGFYTKDGLLLVVTIPDGRVMHQGIRITQDPVMDYMALHTLALQCENTLDKEKGLLLDHPKADEGGIVDQYGNTIEGTGAEKLSTDDGSNVQAAS